jgi:hypothetical protein
MAYHIRKIQKGTIGFSSKIREELEELEDAEAQGNKVLALCELADLVGAIDCYLKVHFHQVNIDDLHKMAKANAKAFQKGER